MASVMGESGDIVFPKLDEERDMIPFEQVAVDLLHALGMEPDVCASEAEAREKVEVLKRESSKVRDSESANVPEVEAADTAKGFNSRTLELQNVRTSSSWPVYFFESDTSGEKTFEEFYTPGEVLDVEKFVNLGVVKNAKRRDVAEIDGIFAALKALFDAKDISKASVVEVLKDYLPNFEHIETGKGLDQKM
jgi:hypothetical protein